jgi:hypothetical protein
MIKVFRELSKNCVKKKNTEIINNYIRTAEWGESTWNETGNVKELLSFIAYNELLQTENNRWLFDYLEGNYRIRDRRFHNMPLDVEEYLNNFARFYGDECYKSICFHPGVNLKLYRALSFDSHKEIREWYNDEVIKIDDRSIELKTNKYTSWSSNHDDTLEFTEDNFAVIFSCTFYPKEYNKFWNLSLLNEYECEFLVRPGIIKGKIESIYKDEDVVSSFNDWAKNA